jgi:hypothetical protein
MTLPRREPITDLELIVGYPVEVQQPTRAGHPTLAAHIAEFLNARHQDCNAEPRIYGETQARATLQAHRHHVSAPCFQKRAALAWLNDHGLIVRSSQHHGAD